MHVEVKRQMGKGDIATVSELLDLASKADGHVPIGDHQWVDLVQGGRRGFAGLVAWEPGYDNPVGYAQVSRGSGTWALEVVVDPEHRTPDGAIARELLGAALEVVGAQGGGHVHLWVPKPTDELDTIVVEAGLTRGRELYQMRRSLPVPPEAGQSVETRPFRVGVDEKRWLEVNNRAFSWHPEQGGWDLDTIVAREAEPWFDPEGFRLHERDGRLAAFCWTKVHAHTDPPLGEIYVIAVDPDFQHLGLGRSLVVSGLEWLVERGLKVGMLYVDAANQGAVALYRDMGFELDHLDRAYIADVPAI